MSELICRRHARVSYAVSLDAMRQHIAGRNLSDPDECWIMQHDPVYTLGQAGRPEHILNPADIPVVQSDRGGQVTYHGPGQLIVYTLFDLRRLGIGVRSLVQGLENVVIAMLNRRGVEAHGRRDAPGVYVGDAKIAALGLRVKRGLSYHGLSLNIDMDLGPFAGINPCGFAGLEVIDMRSLGVDAAPESVIDDVLNSLCHEFRYNRVIDRPPMDFS